MFLLPRISAVLLCLVAGVLFVGAPSAEEDESQPVFPMISASGEYTGVLSCMVDDVFPDEETAWDCSLNVAWEDTATFFVIDLGLVQRVEHVVVCVDNNDVYSLEASVDGTDFFPLLTIDAELGDIAFGIECLASEETHPQYEAALAFAPVEARYVRFRAIEGDQAYAVGEIQITTSAATIPQENVSP